MGSSSVLTEAIGTLAAILTTIAFAPQAIRTWRVGGQGLSWLTLLLFGLGVGLWFVYGILRNSVPLMLANGLTGLQVIFIFAIKVCGARPERQRDIQPRAIAHGCVLKRAPQTGATT